MDSGKLIGQIDLEVLLFVYLIPWVAFMVGVTIFVSLKYHEQYRLSITQVYLMSIPVGLVLIGFLVSNFSVTIGSGISVNGPTSTGNVQTVRYGFMESPARYLLFNGLLVFFGTLVPDVFLLFRDKLRKRADSIKGIDAP